MSSENKACCYTVHSSLKTVQNLNPFSQIDVTHGRSVSVGKKKKSLTAEEIKQQEIERQ